MTRPLRCFVEGTTDIPVVKRVLELCQLDWDQPIIAAGGYSQLDALLPKLRSYARSVPVLVVRDVDPTPPNLRGKRFTRCASDVLDALDTRNSVDWFRLRLARHEVESWLLADHKGPPNGSGSPGPSFQKRLTSCSSPPWSW